MSTPENQTIKSPEVGVMPSALTEGSNAVVATSSEEETETSTPVVNVIEAQNPDAEAMKQLMEHVQVNYDFEVTVKPVKFNFKRSTDKDSGIITDRKTVELAIPYPSMNGIIKILEEGGLGLELIIEAIEGIVNTQARDILNEDTTYKLNAANFPVEKLAWEFIAKLPKAQRRGGGIPKEVWEAFATDYIAVMPEATGKTVEQVANAAKILHSKLATVKTQEAILQLLVEQLAIYADVTDAMEEFGECVEFLLKKADAFLNVTEEELLANL